MASTTYRLSWQTCDGRPREKYFYSLRQLQSFKKRECKMIESPFLTSIWDGKSFNKFVIIGGKVLTRVDLEDLLRQIL